MWKILDEQLSLKECNIYSYSPDEDPSDADDGAIWSLHYFFFNRIRKRVCYLYVKAIPILSHTPSEGLATPVSKRTFDDGILTPNLSTSKRAKYWFGDNVEIESDSDGENKYLMSDEDFRSRSVSKGTVRAMSEEIADSMEV